MNVTIFRSEQSGIAANCVYPIREQVNNLEDLLKAVSYDHVCAEYKENYRGNDNFLSSDVIPMDIDNDHSDNPAQWMTAGKMAELFDNYNYVLVPSRHHMKEKGNKSARPRYHVYFQITGTENLEYYVSVKKALHKKFPFFDGNALDAARFLYGSEASKEECVWNEGWLNIEDEVENLVIDDTPNTDIPSIIMEGSRNNTMSRFAGRILKRFGNTKRAYEAFVLQAEKCEPPLEDDELRTIWNSALKFFETKVVSSEGYMSPEDYEFETRTLKPEEYTELDETYAFLKEYSAEVKYTTATDFLRYDGKMWCKDNHLANCACVEFFGLQLAEAKEQLTAAEDALMEAGIDKEIVKAGEKAILKAMEGTDRQLYYNYVTANTYHKFLMKNRNARAVNGVMSLTKSLVNTPIDQFDKDAFLLNTPDGTYDLRKGMKGKREHKATDYITKITLCSPSDEGAELWDNALNMFFCNDQETIDYVQQVMGLAAIGKVFAEHLIIAYGGGSNGKSTFWNTVANVLGTYSGTLSAEILTMGNRRNAKPEMADLKGKRLALASELEEGTRLNASMVKQLCSTDTIRGEEKFKAPFDFTPSHTLVLFTNFLPKVGSYDLGIWRRLIVIPFNATIQGSADIKNYSEYLVENAGSAIMKWIIEGAKKAIEMEYKLELPASVSNAIDKYKDENDWLSHFLTECCEINKIYTQKSGELYQQYRAYCVQNGEYVRNKQDFYTALENKGFEKKRVSAGVVIYGLRLITGGEFAECR